jgi:Na+-transporting NADH:ubiquinone oxidoreductase subunit B
LCSHPDHYGIGSWKIMLSTVIGGSVMGLLLNTFAGSNAYKAMPFWEHLIIGGFAFGAVFMATDPVSAAQTEPANGSTGF